MRAYPLILACLLCVCSLGQSNSRSKAVADSVRNVIADLRAHMVAADSLNDVKSGIEHRMRLAEMERPAKAINLYQEAVALADSANLNDEELRARIGLQGAHVATKDWKAAYEQSLVILGLTEQRNALTASAVVEASRVEVERNAARADSLSADLDEVRLLSANAIAEVEGRAKMWMLVAGGIGLIAVLLLALFVVSSRRKHARFAEELRSLKAEVATLKQPRNRLREEPPVPPTAPAVEEVVVAVEEPAAPIAPVVDPEVLAHFTKRAPERLATLRDARARGDMEKVVRVVHTLKPLLVGLDADRFAPLCARLVEPTAVGSPAWTADADALEAGVASYL